MRGIETYTTEDGVRVLLLHYSADVEKDPDTPEGAKWLRSMLKGWPGGMEGAKWQQEMELNFTIKAGEKVFPMWDSRLYPHVTFEPGDVELEDHWTLYGGFDWGISNKTVFTAHAFESEDRAYQFDEIVWQGADHTPDTVAEEIMRKPYWDRIREVVGDPSIWVKNQVSGTYRTSIGEMLSNAGVYVTPGRNEAGVDMTFVALLKRLWQNLESPRWTISRACTDTIRCFKNLRFKPLQGNLDLQRKPEEIVQRGIDEFDSCKYILLSRGFEGVEMAEVLPGTFDWFVREAHDFQRRNRGAL